MLLTVACAQSGWAEDGDAVAAESQTGNPDGAAVVIEQPQLAAETKSRTKLDAASAPRSKDLGYLKEMVISASQNEPVQDRTELGKLTAATPMSGTVITREELDNVKFVDPRREMLRRVPGFTMIRNIRIPDGGKSYTDKRVDGMRVDSSGNFQVLNETNPADIERVEVITGPGSVLNSSSAYGGTINVITREPPNETERSVSQENGSRGYYRTDVAMGGITPGKVGYFLDANYMHNPGWQQSTDDKKKAASGKVVVRPDDVSKLTMRLEYLNEDALAPGTLTEAQFDADWRQSAPGAYSRSDITYITPSAQYKRFIGEHGELNVSLSRRRNDSTSYSATSASSNKLSDTVATDSGMQTVYRHDFEKAQSSLYVGVDAMSTDSDAKSYRNTESYANALGGQFSRGTLTSSAVSTETTTSPFIHYEFSPVNRLRLSIGTRFDKIEYTMDDQMPSNKDGGKTFSRNVVKTGASYDLNDNDLVWARVGQGFLAPSVSTMLGSGGTVPVDHATAVTAKYVPADMTLKPEESVTYEMGLRGKLAGRDLNYDVAIYRTDITNLMVKQDCGATELCYQRNVNAGKASLKGLEAAMMYALNSWMDINLAYTVSSVTYTDYVQPTFNYSGNHWKNTPPQHLNLRLSFKPAPGLRMELVADHMNAYYLNNENEGGTYQRPDIFDLRTSYNIDQWSAWLHILNILDTKYGERVQKMAGVTNPRTFGDGYNPLTLRAGIAYRF